jgi:hypothetical protein
MQFIWGNRDGGALAITDVQDGQQLDLE